MRIRLKNPGCFFDPETRLRLEYGNYAEVTRVGSLTRMAMNAGGILIVPPDTPPIPTIEEKIVEPELIAEEDYIIAPVVKIPEKTVVTKKTSKRGRPRKASK